MYSSFILSSGNRKPEVSELHKHIVPKYAARWRDLGVQLKIPEHHLNTIAVNNTNHPSYSEQCCKAVLEKWMDITHNATWNMLHLAIDHFTTSSHNSNYESMNYCIGVLYRCTSVSMYIPII